MEDNNNNMSTDLVEAGLKLASSPWSGSNRGTEFLDRTIFHTVYVTDAAGNVMIDSEGNKIARNQVLWQAGAWLSKAEMANAVEVEKQFKELNDMLRADMTRQGLQWRFSKGNLRALQIQGVTGTL